MIVNIILNIFALIYIYIKKIALFLKIKLFSYWANTIIYIYKYIPHKIILWVFKFGIFFKYCLKIFFKIIVIFLLVYRRIKQIILIMFFNWYICLIPFLIKRNIYIHFTFLNPTNSFLEIYLLLIMFIIVIIWELEIFISQKNIQFIYKFIISIFSNILGISLIKVLYSSLILKNGIYLYLNNIYFSII